MAYLAEPDWSLRLVMEAVADVAAEHVERRLQNGTARAFGAEE